jgi:hypothetical protein
MFPGAVLHAAHSQPPAMLPGKVDYQGIQPLRLATVRQAGDYCQLARDHLMSKPGRYK